MRTVATAIGLLIALGILAMTVVCCAARQRATSARSPRRERRAGCAARSPRPPQPHSLLGAVLGTVGAYTALVARYLDDLAPLGRVPVVNLAVVLVGLPVAAAVAGWLLAGREPPALAR